MELYQKEEDVVVVGGIIFVVHTEGSIYVAQMVMVVQLSKRRISQLSFATEALV